MALPQDDARVRARWSGFAWTEANARQAAVRGAIDVVFGECDR